MHTIVDVIAESGMDRLSIVSCCTERIATSARTPLNPQGPMRLQLQEFGVGCDELDARLLVVKASVARQASCFVSTLF
jgi:hypothetical protein